MKIIKFLTKHHCIILLIAVIILFVFVLIYHQSLEVMYKSLLIAQSLVIMIGVIFTSQWTYKTFGYKEKISTLQKIMFIIDNYYAKLQVFYVEIRDSNKMTKNEMKKRFTVGEESVNVHKEIKTSLWIEKKIRDDLNKRIINLFSVKKINNMIESTDKLLDNTKREKEWKEFEKEYNEINDIIEKELKKYI